MPDTEVWIWFGEAVEALMARRRIKLETALPTLRDACMAANRVLGGGSGIRTHDTVSRIHAFQASAFSHSATPPQGARNIAGRLSETTRAGARLARYPFTETAGFCGR